MKVKCINSKFAESNDFALNKEYEVVEDLGTKYCLIDDVKDRNYVNKNNFKIVSK